MFRKAEPGASRARSPNTANADEQTRAALFYQLFELQLIQARPVRKVIMDSLLDEAFMFQLSLARRFTSSAIRSICGG